LGRYQKLWSLPNARDTGLSGDPDRGLYEQALGLTAAEAITAQSIRSWRRDVVQRNM
jgi:hypothetical protein